MLQAVIRWSIPLSALFIAGPIAGAGIATLRSSTGSTHTTPLLSSSPFSGVVYTVLAFVIAAVPALAAARFVGPRLAIFTAGLTLAWPAFTAGQIDTIIRDHQGKSMLVPLAVEGLVVALLLLALTFVITRTARTDPRNAHETEHKLDIFSPHALLSLAAATVLAAIGVWLIAVTTLKGQTIAATAAGGVLAAIACRLASPTSPTYVIYIAGGVLMCLSPIVAIFVHTGDSLGVPALLDSMHTGDLLPLARPIPFDYAAGVLLGAPVGLGWASSMVDKHKP